MLDSGELAALGTALSWTASTLFFGLASRSAGSMAVNQFRIMLAVPVLALAHLLLTGTLWPSEVPADRLRTLCLSGVVGLVIGDIGYFYALAMIGPRVSSVLMATWPCMAMLLAWGTVGEMPTAWEVAGLLLSTTGVILVLLRAREGSAWNQELTPVKRAWAVAGALLGALGQAGGWALSRVATAPGPDLPEGVAGVSAAFVRMVAACAGIVVVAVACRRATVFRRVFVDRRTLTAAMAGTLFGPVLGVWMSMLAVRDSGRSAAATALIASTPIWMMPVSYLVWRARIGMLGVIGTLLTVAGAGLLLWQQ